MMRDVKILFLALIISTILITGSAFAFMPSDRGASYPSTVWLDRGIKGSVSGKVVTSLDQTTGVEGAYVAVVDAMNPSREYANTTTSSNGEFSIGNLGATYSSVRQKGPDGSAGTLQQGMNMFMLYVNKSDLGEGYSETFGIDTNHTSTPMGQIVIYTGSQVTGSATPEPIATPEPTVQPTVVVPTPEPPTVTPAPSTGISVQSLIVPVLVVALLVILAIGAAVVYFKFLRKGLIKKLKKK